MNNGTNVTAAGCGGAGEAAVGVVMTTIGAALLAFSMVVQRYGLSYPEPRIRFGCVSVPKELASWTWYWRTRCARYA